MNVKQGNLKRMLNPSHIVFIGSKNIIRQGIQNCKNIGFRGKVYAVHKTEVEIEKVRCYKSINELPETPEAAFIAIRSDKATEVIKELRAMGVSGCVCYAAGFSEVGNKQLETDLIEAAGNMALIGPNCYGTINFLDQVPLWPDRFGSQPMDKGVAIISQSGNLSFNITMNDRSLPLAYVFSIGNQTVLDIADYVMAMCDDPRVTAIGLHIEGLHNINKFMQAAQIASDKGIPIVAFKTGISKIGSQLTMSHTSSLAGSDELYQALFTRFNICRVDSLSAFLETLKLFSVTGVLTGRNLGVLTVSGGESTITADIAEKNGFSLPELDEEQKKKIKALMKGLEHVSNPLDYNASLWGHGEKLLACFTSFMQEKFHTTLLVLDYLDKDYIDIDAWETVINAFIRAGRQTRSKALVISVLPEGMPAYFREMLLYYGITPLQGITDAFTAINAAAKYNERKACNYPSSTNLLLSEQRAEEGETTILNEWQGKQELHAYGLTIPNGGTVTIHDANVISEGMKAPFVVKGLSTSIVHKSDVGGVRLNVRSEEEVRESLIQMHKDLAGDFGSEMHFLVEEMVSGAVAELNIGIKKDDQFGLALVISMGGELVNLMNDSIPILLPANRAEILEALYSLKGIGLLKGYRGRPQGDIEAVLNAAESISLFAEANRNTLLEMDVNPLLVLPEGQGVIAADAFIRTVADTDRTEVTGVQVNFG